METYGRGSNDIALGRLDTELLMNFELKRYCDYGNGGLFRAGPYEDDICKVRTEPNCISLAVFDPKQYLKYQRWSTRFPDEALNLHVYLKKSRNSR